MGRSSRTDGERATGEVWALGGGCDCVLGPVNGFGCCVSCTDALACRRIVGGGRSGVGSVV